MVWLRMLERRAAIHLARHTLILTLSPPPIFGGSYSGSISQRYQVSSELQRIPVTFNPELRGAIQESIQLQQYRDVPHGTNLDAGWILLDRRRAVSQPPDRFVRELR